jgi:hypothetical protein
MDSLDFFLYVLFFDDANPFSVSHNSFNFFEDHRPQNFYLIHRDFMV